MPSQLPRGLCRRLRIGRPRHILDKDGTTVAFLGDNPDKSQWANYALPPADIAPAVFSAAHGCFVDRNANIYISDWNQSGRVTKLERVTR